MREVVYRNLTSVSSRKKDIFLQEVFERDGVIAKTERRCFYFIKGVNHITDQEEMQKWLDTQNQSKDVNKKHFYIFREHNDEHGEDRLLCKILGEFYVVVDSSVYTIAFLHSFRVIFEKSSLAK